MISAFAASYSSKETCVMSVPPLYFRLCYGKKINAIELSPVVRRGVCSFAFNITRRGVAGNQKNLLTSVKKYDKIYPVLDVPFQKHHVMN